MPEPDPAEPVLLAGRYRLGAALGRGGMSTVYRAWDEKLRRPVAVKVFSADGAIGSDPERRLREAHVLAAASHPHLATLFDAEWPAGPDDRRPAFLVMELIEGESLRRRIEREGADPDLARRLGRELGAALEYLHRRGIVHRDVKPENILIEDAGGSVKLVDFGIAQLIGSEKLTTAGLVLGTAGYLSPEQVSGSEVGPATDVYSLGLVVLECLTGHREFPGPAVESSVARLARDPVLPAGLSADWGALLRSMTARDPGERPAAARLAASFDALGPPGELSSRGDGGPTAILTAAPTLLLPSSSDAPTIRLGPEDCVEEAPPAVAPSRRRPIAVAIAVVIAAVVLAGAVLAWSFLSAGQHPATPAHTPAPTVVVTVSPTPTPPVVPGPGKPKGNHGNGNGKKKGHG
ncbi:hypothetical protein GCM10027414_34410 [Humibacter ginsengiterrae]